jgi:general secretion pathway protein A
MDSQSLGVLLLVGQPALRRTLRLTPYEAFYQRISTHTHYHLPPFDVVQTITYVRHHVHLAEYKDGTLFTDDALDRIYEYAKGIPRLTNRLCVTALLVTAAENRQVVEESSIRKAIAELEQN